MTRIKRFLTIRPLPNKFPPLHGLRAVAIMLIVSYHVTPRYVPQLLNLWFLMDLVFVLSGFLIGLILLADLERKQGGLLRFYLRRSIRILPPYYVALLTPAVIFGIPEAQRDKFWKELVFLTNYPFGGYFMNWSWSLSLDEHFYAICPLLILALRRLKSVHRQLAVLCLLWASCLPVRFAILTQYDAYDWNSYLKAIYYPTHCRYDTLIAGMLLAYAFFYFPETIERLFRKRSIQYAAVGVSIMLFSLFAAAPFFFPFGTYHGAIVFTFCLGTLSGIAYVALFLYVILVPTRFSHFLGGRTMRYLATLSYGFYLVHLFVHRYLTRPALKIVGINYPESLSFGGWVSECLFVTVVSMIFAYGMHILIEKPALSFRDRYIP